MTPVEPDATFAETCSPARPGRRARARGCCSAGLPMRRCRRSIARSWTPTWSGAGCREFAVALPRWSRCCLRSPRRTRGPASRRACWRPRCRPRRGRPPRHGATGGWRGGKPLAARPRIAWEAAYALTLVLVLVVATRSRHGIPPRPGCGSGPFRPLRSACPLRTSPARARRWSAGAPGWQRASGRRGRGWSTGRRGPRLRGRASRRRCRLGEPAVDLHGRGHRPRRALGTPALSWASDLLGALRPAPVEPGPPRPAT